MSKEYLEALKIVERDCEDLEQVPYGEFALIEKYLKALEIIKEKNVNVYWFKSELTLRNISYRYYVNNFDGFHNGLVVKLLDEEEFNLLREVLE